MRMSGVCNRSAHKGSHDSRAAGVHKRDNNLSNMHLPLGWYDPTWLVYVEQVVAWLLVGHVVAQVLSPALCVCVLYLAQMHEVLRDEEMPCA
jgi:hypothetical protein